MDIKIRPVNTLTDLRKCHEIQRATWGYTDLMVFPYTQLISSAHNGGVLLGSYDGPDLVGFVYGYVGRKAIPVLAANGRIAQLSEPGHWHETKTGSTRPNAPQRH